jgi:hypothetical protein
MRYFFTIHGPNSVEDDPDGMDLPSAAAALSEAERAIAELKKRWIQGSRIGDARARRRTSHGLVLTVSAGLRVSNAR